MRNADAQGTAGSTVLSSRGPIKIGSPTVEQADRRLRLGRWLLQEVTALNLDDLYADASFLQVRFNDLRKRGLDMALKVV